MTSMNVLSLFDGMSCGRIALDRTGIPVGKYYASEIDKYAIKVSESNYPDIIRLGDVRGVRASDLERIDLLIGGSPCQGFSFAGKQLNFDDPRSALFFEFVRILNECRAINPELLFLLENVKMKREFQNVITQHLGVEPIEINSALVSAQNRKRLYWTNIGGVTQPKDRGIMLRDIITSGFVEKYKSWALLQSWSRFPKKTESAKMRYGRSMMPIIFESVDCSFEIGWRPPNRIEAERLQCVPDGYTKIVNESIALGMLGNGWTVDVIAHILSFIGKHLPTTSIRQLNPFDHNYL